MGSVTDAWGYSSFGEPANYVARYSGGAIFENQFIRDKLGRITQKTETVSGTTTVYDYTYDQTGRLTQVKRNGAITATYDYDANSNRLSRTSVAGIESGIYDAQDRLLSYDNFTYTYTANGELTSKTDTSTGQTTQYEYDLMGNLLKVNLPDGRQIDYVIDGQNRRVGKKVNGSLTQGFLYDGQIQIAAELDGSNNVVSRFVFAEKGNVPSSMIKGGQTYRIISDHLGSPRLVVNTTDGTIAQKMDYDEFGRVLVDTNPGFQPFGFAGGLYDGDTGLVRFGLRDYDAYAGRWTSKDPILFAGGDTNLFGYVVNDPVNRFDLTGLLDIYVNVDVDIVGISGIEVGGGIVIDLFKPIESGIFVVGGPASGANVGAGIGVGFALREVEGDALNFDINLGKISVVASFDNEGFNGFSVNFGPGKGLSESYTNTKTLSINDIVNWIMKRCPNSQKKDKKHTPVIEM